MFENKEKEQVLEELETNFSNGLTSDEIAKRKEKYGANKLTEKKKKPAILVFFSQMNDPMIYILFAAAIISFILSFYNTSTGEWSTKNVDYVEPLVILGVVLLNSIIGTVQEIKAEKSLEALKKLSAPVAIVRRNGETLSIPAEELVPGDIVILEEGSQVPADIRLLKSVNLKADESSLTGESVPVEKNADVVFSEEVGIGDRTNIVYMSTPISYGHGEGVVICTGMSTEIGHIATMLDEKDEATPLQKKLADLSKLLGWITIGLVVLFFVIGLIQAHVQNKEMVATMVAMFVTSISLAVAAIPEGLPAVVTIVLSLGVQRMVKVNTIVRKLHSVETLGSVTVVCSDKTGTLTQNRMTVVEAFVDGKSYIQNEFVENKNYVEELAIGLSLCSNAKSDGKVKYGDPTEIALVDFANLLGDSKEDLQTRFVRTGELPFDSVRKMMSTQNQIDEKTVRTYTKGAMDQILKHCSYIYKDGKVCPITDADIQNLVAENTKMSDKALRVLALAYKDGGQLEEENLIFYGMIGMVDPPREEAKPAIQTLTHAQILTVMITGDHKDTAFAIASELGIVESKDQCMSGDEISASTPEELQEKVKICRVFARVSPENKVSIVQAFKANGNIVAMTGDGVNDAPSLKAADIGIAMGISGTDVAKGAADMILSDDNFASIEKAVEEGRGIFFNIRKTILFLLSSNIGEVVCMLLAVLVGLPAPLAAIHILFVNLITDSIPAIALGADKKPKDIMDQAPRDPKASLFAEGGYMNLIVYGALIGLITLVAFLFYPVMEVGGLNIAAINEAFNNNPQLLVESETCAFIVLGLAELFHMLNMSNEGRSAFRVFGNGNWLFLVSFGIGIFLPVLLTEVDALNNIFQVYHLDWQQWLIMVALSTAPLVLHEIIIFIKFIHKKFAKIK